MPSLATFEQQIDIKPIQTIKGRFISKDFIKTGFIKTDFIKIKLLLIQPSSASAERVFSLLNNAFNDQQAAGHDRT